MMILTTLIVGLVAIPIFYLISPIAGLATLLLFLVGFYLLSRRAKKRKAEFIERLAVGLEMYGPGTPVEYLSYYFDDEGLSRVAEVISASRVSELPFSMPYREKIDRLAKDGSIVILPCCSGTDRILSGIQSIIKRRGLTAAVITKEVVIAENSERFRTRRRDGFIADVVDLNVLAHKLESEGFLLLNLMYHPYRGACDYASYALRNGATQNVQIRGFEGHVTAQVNETGWFDLRRNRGFYPTASSKN